jgi:ceramide glucosyltransferase
VPVVRRLLEEFAGRDIRLIITGKVNSANRKVGILAALSRHARHDLWIISDGDIRVSATYLKDVVSAFRDPQVGMATCLYRGSRAETLPALIEMLMVQLEFLPAVLVAEQLEEFRFGFGATMAVRRAAVSAIGGFESLREYIADDYELAYRIFQAGYRIVLCRKLVEVVIGELRIADVFEHQLRWARTYKICRPNGYFATILTHGFLLSAANLLISRFSLDAWLLFCAAGGVRLYMANLILQQYLKQPGWREALMLVPLEELFSVMIWSIAFLGNRISWRGTTFNLVKDGRMVVYKPSAYLGPDSRPEDNVNGGRRRPGFARAFLSGRDGSRGH